MPCLYLDFLLGIILFCSYISDRISPLLDIPHQHHHPQAKLKVRFYMSADTLGIKSYNVSYLAVCRQVLGFLCVLPPLFFQVMLCVRLLILLQLGTLLHLQILRLL